MIIWQLFLILFISKFLIDIIFSVNIILLLVLLHLITVAFYHKMSWVVYSSLFHLFDFWFYSILLQLFYIAKFKVDILFIIIIILLLFLFSISLLLLFIMAHQENVLFIMTIILSLVLLHLINFAFNHNTLDQFTFYCFFKVILGVIPRV